MESEFIPGKNLQDTRFNSYPHSTCILSLTNSHLSLCEFSYIEGDQITSNIKYKPRKGPKATLEYNNFLETSRPPESYHTHRVCNKKKIKLDQEETNLQSTLKRDRTQSFDDLPSVQTEQVTSLTLVCDNTQRLLPARAHLSLRAQFLMGISCRGACNRWLSDDLHCLSLQLSNVLELLP